MEPENNIYEYDAEFRDVISTVDAEGKRVWVYPKKPKGYFHRARAVVAVFLLSLFFLVPFIKVDGHPFFLFNVFERKFIIFGAAFWPQDFILFALAFIAFVVFIVLFTVIFGRFWCGWACPQTVFMEMVFRKIEYWIEGDAPQQRKLDKAPWTQEKILKKTSKHIIFLLISLLIAHTAMAYLIGIDEVREIVTKSPMENLSGFIGLLAFTAIFYGVFARFREQACTTVCPYGRFQGVFLDKKSIVVAYDWLRGEKRGKLKKNATPPADQGDCIDCKLCVHVCPTGIDIRNGTQLECVNCTACIDVCDEVMDKVNKPKGLIRYTSEEQIQHGHSKIFNTRSVAYSVVLVVILGLLTTLLATRTDVEATMLRVPGMLYQKTDNGEIQNLYNVKFINKTFSDVSLELKLENFSDGTIERVGGEPIKIGPNDLTDAMFFVRIPQAEIHTTKTELEVGVYHDGELMVVEKTNFLGPIVLKK
ncbi:cytochrome c oxidase accessory protein CcoG [Persicobacter psychrovividus]|uniref:Cytochrome c oxidase accessory protein CcoG n=1 Tax=Persicobacter psychrovividus TaxID=387638 RepID=A0ABM7VH76_9BACT|nr:cytochrome c oxidase accessory protein CcoG [Persicobacter psychrovividus]